MERKRIIELSKRARADAERNNKKTESQKSSVPQKSTKKWQNVLAVEWLWFMLTLLVSWIVSNILEYYIYVGAEVIAIILFVFVYVARLTSWAVKQVGKE
jgi:hypothetical protein